MSARNYIIAMPLAVLALVGCGGDNPQEPESSAGQSAVPVPTTTTVVVDGKTYGCGELTVGAGETCLPEYQKAFNRWAEHIDSYVNSETIRASRLGEIRYEDIAAYGLAACIQAERGDGFQVFSDFVDGGTARDRQLTNQQRLDMFFSAPVNLCRDVNFPEPPADYQPSDISDPNRINGEILP